MFNNDDRRWKYFPYRGKAPQFVYCPEGNREKATENPENPAEEFKAFAELNKDLSIIILPCCSEITYKAATAKYKRVIVLDNDFQRLQLFKKHVTSHEVHHIKDYFELRGFLGEIFIEVAIAEASAYLPQRFGNIDPELKKLLQDDFFQIQKEFASFAVHRSLCGWHKNLNALMNLRKLKFVGHFPNLNKQPAVIVGAGPSLDDTIETLRLHKGKAFIIATDGAVQSLLKNDVIPDYIVSCDDSNVIYRYIGNEKQLENVPLFLDVRGSHILTDTYLGPVVLTRANGVSDWINSLASALPVLELGRCVGHMAFNLAIALNCGQIIMTGFDLGFKEDRFHPKDMPNPYFHDVDVPAPVTVEAVDGGFIRSDLSMLIYLRDFEWLIRSTKLEVIDATEGGAKKEGAIVKTLKESLRHFTEKVIIPTEMRLCDISQKMRTLLDEFGTERNSTLKESFINSFGSYLVQNSMKSSPQDKNDDYLSSVEFIKSILKRPQKGTKEILIDHPDLPDEIVCWAKESEVEIIEDLPVPDLINFIKDSGVSKVYSLNRSLLPDIPLIAEIESVDIKTTIEVDIRERSHWVEGYSVWAMPEVYDFWADFLPSDIEIDLPVPYQTITKVG